MPTCHGARSGQNTALPVRSRSTGDSWANGAASAVASAQIVADVGAVSFSSLTTTSWALVTVDPIGMQRSKRRPMTTSSVKSMSFEAGR